MRTVYLFNECAEALKTQVRTYWAAKQRQLEQSLPPGTPQDVTMDLFVIHESQASRYEVRAVLSSLAGTSTAEAGGPDVQAVLDRVAELLMQDAGRGPTGDPSDPVEDGELLDMTSADSFPASDAPSWTTMTASGPPSSS